MTQNEQYRNKNKWGIVAKGKKKKHFVPAKTYESPICSNVLNNIMYNTTLSMRGRGIPLRKIYQT